MDDPCENGGTCEEGVGEAICRCADGFMGHLCQDGMQSISFQCFRILYFIYFGLQE